MNRGQIFLSGLGLGAAAMYIADPYWGKRRRALVRDQVIHAMHKGEYAAGVTSRDIANRTHGLVAEAKSRLSGDHEDVSDQVLEARIRSKIGRVIGHPGAISVSAADGRVALRGPVLASELRDLLRTVRSVRGVREVVNELDVHEHGDDVPSLQGGGRRPGSAFELTQSNWSPTARLLAGIAGGVAAAIGAGRGKSLGLLTAVSGAALVARAATNMEMKRLVGIGAGHRAVDLQKTIRINAPIEEVFAFWDNYENFPHFMRNVRKITRANGHSYWSVAGPGGIPVEWQAEITGRVPNQAIAWKTLAGSPIAHAGIVRFFPVSDEVTRVDIKLSYNPLAGALGHVLASVLGANPKRELDEDMVRMKTMIETGKVPHDASAPTQN